MESRAETLSIKYAGDGILNSIEQQIALARKLEGVYEHRPDPKDFIGAMEGTPSAKEYTKEAIQADIEYVKQRKEAIDKSNKEKGAEVLTLLESGFSLSEMMQAMIVDRINKGMLPGFKAVMTTERDDLKVGIDAVLKKKEYGYLGAAFDFTLSSNITTIQDKLEKTWNFSIKKHHIPTVKYFEDPDTHIKGSLLVPKFIIGGSKKDIEFFAQKYLEGKEEELNNHPFKYLMVKQIDEQLKAALRYFESKKDDKDFNFIHGQFKKIETFIEDLKNEINYHEFVKTKEFFEYKKQNRAYSAMKNFFFDK